MGVNDQQAESEHARYRISFIRGSSIVPPIMGCAYDDCSFDVYDPSNQSTDGQCDGETRDESPGSSSRDIEFKTNEHVSPQRNATKRSPAEIQSREASRSRVRMRRSDQTRRTTVARARFISLLRPWPVKVFRLLPRTTFPSICVKLGERRRVPQRHFVSLKSPLRPRYFTSR